MPELSHPVIIKPSEGTILKWQISLCFIYPTVSTPLHGEFVSIGTWCYFGLCKHVQGILWLRNVFACLFCSVSSPLLSVTSHGNGWGSDVSLLEPTGFSSSNFLQQQLHLFFYTSVFSWNITAITSSSVHDSACVCVCVPRGCEWLRAKETAELLKISVRVSSNSSLLFCNLWFKAIFHFGCTFLTP